MLVVVRCEKFPESKRCVQEVRYQLLLFGIDSPLSDCDLSIVSLDRRLYGLKLGHPLGLSDFCDGKLKLATVL